MLKMKTCLAALAAGLVLCAAPAGAAAYPDYPFVHVTGSAFRPVIADIAALDFLVTAADADPAVARKQIDERVAEVYALLDHLTIDRDDASIGEVRQDIRKNEKSATGGPVYELRADVHINVRNLTNWPALAGGLYGKPNLDGFAAAFDISNMKEVMDGLMADAIADARHHAEVIAAASGRRLGQVMAVSPEQLKNLTTSLGLEREEFRQPRRQTNSRPQTDRDDLMMIQVLKLRQPVDVLFKLENPPPARGRTAAKGGS